jgi:peptidoglycan/LPS O-acetylase OafA/YrhL
LGGEISYGVYLLQAPLSHVLYTILGHMPFSFLHSPAWIVLIYPFSWLTYTRIEKPCRAWLLHRAPSRSEKPIPTPQPELP